MANIDILVFKLIKAGTHGKVIDALWSLRRKRVRLKYRGLLSLLTQSMSSVKQGGNTSPTISR